MFDILVIGGGVAGVSCAMILGSAHSKPYMSGRRIGIIAHQKSSNLQEALFNNAYGIKAGTWGSDLLESTLEQVRTTYPSVEIIEGEKVLRVDGSYPNFTVTTNKAEYQAANIVVAIGFSNTFAIEGLTDYIEPHKKAIPEKHRIQLKNEDHKVADGIYVAGTLAGWRSQLSIAAGSGAAVGTDLLTLFNNGIQSQSHDKR
ncbi:FAD-dependent oxidoreductase [Flavobacterium silvaticum]|uniref:FAD-dependent oxidoreductase n=1 Tax=Flavobacterium silvaticum TaxID=1852020 RepID=A0A972JG30_9FLAO|nr:FAD-dependent oxidoreductase [Flavobacterium silvaticum]NMH27776.1 FAD-dependent oxidoreductase [Flavobacterium silvaticum]